MEEGQMTTNFTMIKHGETIGVSIILLLLSLHCPHPSELPLVFLDTTENTR